MNTFVKSHWLGSGGTLRLPQHASPLLAGLMASAIEVLTPMHMCRPLLLEDAIGYVAADELIEVTPGQIRLRKRILESGARRAATRKAAHA